MIGHQPVSEISLKSVLKLPAQGYFRNKVEDIPALFHCLKSKTDVYLSLSRSCHSVQEDWPAICEGFINLLYGLFLGSTQVRCA